VHVFAEQEKWFASKNWKKKTGNLSNNKNKSFI